MSAPPPWAQTALHGHDGPSAVIARALRSGRAPHAWLLEGPAGIGKATLAYRIARVHLAGTDPMASAGGGPLDVPPDHPTAQLVAGRSHPDLLVLSPPADPKSGRAKSETPVDDARGAIRALHATAAMGGGRVLLIDPAEALNASAANALLKLLEEPPAGCLCLLVSSKPARLPRTILSRCARLRLAPLDDGSMTAALDALGVAEPAAALLHAARGAPGRALTLLACDWVARRDAVLAALARPDGAQLRALFDALAPLQKLASDASFEEAVDLLRGLAAAAARSAAGDAGFAGYDATLAALAARHPGARWPLLARDLAALASPVEPLQLDKRAALLRMLLLMRGEAGVGAARAA